MQMITCDAGFRANESTAFTCIEMNETSAEWQPAPGLTTCGKNYRRLNIKVCF